MRAGSRAESALTTALLLFLCAGILYPVLRACSAAVLEEGRPTLGPLLAVLGRPLFLRALGNTLLAGFAAVAFGSLVAVPLAWLLARYQFRGRGVLVALGVLPLVVPPFIGSVALQHILGPRGPVASLLGAGAGATVPLMAGLTGVVLVETLHAFPFIFLGTAAALARVDRSLEEAALSLGAPGVRAAWRILLPLALPGYAAGALVTFIRVIGDLGAPLMLGYPTLVAPQAYARATTAGPADAAGAVACATLAVLALLALGAARAAVGGRRFLTPAGGGGVSALELPRRGAAVIWLLAVLLLGPALLPHVGLLLLSVSDLPSSSPLPAGYTLAHYEEVLLRTPHLVWNSVRYGALAALVAVLLGGLIGWLLLRGQSRVRRWLDVMATLPLAIPGVVIAVGFLRILQGWHIPGLDVPLTATSVALVVVWAVRRLPWAVGGTCLGLAPLPPALEEAAEGAGATRLGALRRITLPLAGRGLVAGGIIAFTAACADFSAAILLTPGPELAPLAYGIYASAQLDAGRGPAAALGVITVVLVAAGTWAAARLAPRAPTGPGGARP
jgi:iron(III) transport system permease protein